MALRLKQQTMLGAGVILATVLTVMVNYVAARHYSRFDWTESELYSLSDKSLAILEQVDREIDAIVFLTPSSAVDQQILEQVDELLDRYAAASPHIRKRVIDPVRDRLEATRLIEDFAIDRANAVVIAAGDDRRVLDRFDFVDYDYSGASAGQGPSVKSFKGEQLITSAILELIEDRKPRVVLTSGHGEASTEAGELRTLSTAAELLGRDNFALDTWQSIGQAVVPVGTDLLVVAGPTYRFLPEEAAAIDTYLTAGGRALFLLDPPIAGDRFTDLGIGALLRRRGVVTAPDLVIDPSQALAVGPEIIYTTDYGSHAIVEPLVGRPTILPLARTVRRANTVPDGYTVVELVHASTASWAETDLSTLPDVGPNASEAQGALSIAVAVAWPAEGPHEDEDPSPNRPNAPRDGRLVVIGDSDFATDGYVFDGANSELLLGAFNWLIERESLLAIAAREPEQMKLSLSTSELRTIYLLSLLVLPGLAVATGIYVHLRRRR